MCGLVVRMISKKYLELRDRFPLLWKLYEHGRVIEDEVNDAAEMDAVTEYYPIERPDLSMQHSYHDHVLGFDTVPPEARGLLGVLFRRAILSPIGEVTLDA
jgi:hypothetical protein